MAERIMLNINHIAKTFNPGTITEKRALTDVDLKLNEGDLSPLSAATARASPRRSTPWQAYSPWTREPSRWTAWM